MKLVDKFTLWFIGVTLLLTPITTYFCYHNIENKIDEAEIARLQEINEITANQLRKSIALAKSIQESPTTITLLTAPLPKEKIEVAKISTHNVDLRHQESRLVVNSFFSINNANYKISSYNYVPSSRQVLNAILGTVIWKLILIILCVGISARVVSQRILFSLRQTMKKIKNFSVKEKVQFPQARTQEFQELNLFLQKMTDKAVDEYAAVKEFSENASHELQTPLAILRNKLELLSETDIEENQAALISDMQNAIEKLSKINRSLTLLAKLENNEYTASENIKFCRIAKDVLAVYEDRIEMKNICVKTNMDKNVLLKIHPTLADMLMNNLLGNAIRHNVKNGSIEVMLTSKKLVIKNTGLPPEMPVEELFRRFKKGNQCSESVGLGLSIVKQICEVSGFVISYQYIDELHILQIDFKSKTQAEIEPVVEANFEVAIY